MRAAPPPDVSEKRPCHGDCFLKTLYTKTLSCNLALGVSAQPNRRPRSSQVGLGRWIQAGPDEDKKEPPSIFRLTGVNTWRRPTLTGPIVPLPLALWRFTSGFGKGPGGSTTLWSPEGNADFRGGCRWIQYWVSGGLSCYVDWSEVIGQWGRCFISPS